MAKFGLAIAGPRKDVSSRDMRDVILDSDLDTPKVDLRPTPSRYGVIVFSFLADPPVGVDVLLYVLPHQMGYVPMHIIAIQDSQTFGNDLTAVYPLPSFIFLASGGYTILSKATTTGISFYVHAFGPGIIGQKARVRYSIFSQPLDA